MESSAAPLSSSRCAQRDPRAYHRRPAIRTWRLIASLTFAAHLIITLVGSDTAQTTSTQSSASVKESAVVAKASSVSGSQVNESLSSNFDDDEDEDGNGGGDEEDIREPLNRTERTYVVYKTMSQPPPVYSYSYDPHYAYYPSYYRDHGKYFHYRPRYGIEAPQRKHGMSKHGIGELLIVLAPMAALPLIGSAALTTFTTLFATNALSAGKRRKKRHIVTRELLEWKLASYEQEEKAREARMKTKAVHDEELDAVTQRKQDGHEEESAEKGSGGDDHDAFQKRRASRPGAKETQDNGHANERSNVGQAFWSGLQFGHEAGGTTESSAIKHKPQQIPRPRGQEQRNVSFAPEQPVANSKTARDSFAPFQEQSVSTFIKVLEKESKSGSFGLSAGRYSPASGASAGITRDEKHRKAKEASTHTEISSGDRRSMSGSKSSLSSSTSSPSSQPGSTVHSEEVEARAGERVVPKKSSSGGNIDAPRQNSQWAESKEKGSFRVSKPLAAFAQDDLFDKRELGKNLEQHLQPRTSHSSSSPTLPNTKTVLHADKMRGVGVSISGAASASATSTRATPGSSSSSLSSETNRQPAVTTEAPDADADESLAASKKATSRQGKARTEDGKASTSSPASDPSTWSPLLANPYLVDIARNEGTREISELDVIQRYLSTMRPEGDYNDEIIATYLSCNGMLAADNHCLERLTCHFTDETSSMKELEKDVSSLIIYAILKNAFVDEQFKSRLRKAAEFGKSIPARCEVYSCESASRVKMHRKPSS